MGRARKLTGGSAGNQASGAVQDGGCERSWNEGLDQSSTLVLIWVRVILSAAPGAGDPDHGLLWMPIRVLGGRRWSSWYPEEER